MRILPTLLCFVCFACSEDAPPNVTEQSTEQVEEQSEPSPTPSGGSLIERMRAQAELEARQETEGTMSFKVDGQLQEMSFFSIPSNQLNSIGTTVAGHTDEERETGLEIVMAFVDVRDLELPADVRSAPAPRTLQEATNVSRPSVIFTYRSAGEVTRAPSGDMVVHLESLEDGFLTGSIDEILLGRGDARVTVSEVNFRVRLAQSDGADVAGAAIVSATERAAQAATMR